MKGKINFPALNKRRKQKAIKKKFAYKQSLCSQLPEVFAKTILRRTPSKETEGNNQARSPVSTNTYSETHGSNYCRKCKQELFDEENGGSEEEKENEDTSQLGGGGTIGGMTDSMLLVAHQMKTMKEQRRKFEEQEKLNEVLQRVQAALKHSGFEFTDDEEVVEIPQQNDLFSIEGQREKKKERSYISEMFGESEKLSLGRDEMMVELENWFDISGDDLANFCALGLDEPPDVLSDDYFIRIHKAFRRSNESINRLVGLLQKSVPSKPRKPLRVKSVRSKLVVPVPDAEQELEAKSSQDSVAEKPIKINKKIYNEAELNGLKGMQQAYKTISTLLNDAAKNTTSSQAKSCYKVGTKQLKMMQNVMERKYEHLTEQEEKVKILTNEMTGLKFIEQQQKKDTQQIRQLHDENQQLRDEVLHLQQCMKELDNAHNAAQYEAAQRVTSRHVSIKLPEETVEIERAETASPEIEIVVNETESIPSVASIRDNLKKKLSSRRSLLQKESSRKMTPTALITKASSIPSATMSRISRQELEEYESESVSSHEQIESIVKSKSDHQPTDQLRQQIHILREELRNSDDRYYEQREELERLRQVVASQSTSKPSERNTIKELKYEKQIEKLEMQQRLMKNEISEKDQELVDKQKLIDQLKHHMEILIKERDKIMNEDEDDDTKTITPEQPKIELPKMDLSEMPRDQLVAKITKQSEKELQRLRNFIVKEQQRFQANLRRHNLDANKIVTKLRHENTQIVRAIAHFKNMVQKIFHQEADDEDDSYLEESSSKLSAEQRLTLSEGAVETLVMLQRKLNLLFVQKRLTVKHTNAGKINAEKELEQCRVQLQKRTEEYNDQQLSIRKADVRNETLARQCQQLTYMNKCLQKEMEPCKELLKKYTSIQEQVERMRTDEKETSKDNELITKELELDRNRLKKELNQLALAQIYQKNTSESSWSRMSCGAKKKVIDKAHSLKQISNLHHEAGRDLLNYCNELVNTQLSQLVKRYMDLQRFKRIKETLKKLAAQYNDEKRFSAHMLRTKERFNAQNSAWNEKLMDLRSEREKAFLLLTRVFGETSSPGGFAVPTIQLLKPTTTEPPKGLPQKTTGKPVIRDKKVGTLHGFGIYESGTTRPSLWQMPPSIPDNLVHVTTPKILAMDILKTRKHEMVQTRKSKLYLPPVATLYP